MAIIYKTKSCLRVIGDGLFPDEISNMLGCEPTMKRTKGESYMLPIGGEPRIAKSGMWRIDAADMSPGDIDKQVSEILSQVVDNTDVWNFLSNKYTLDFYCVLFMNEESEGISLSAESMLALGYRGIQVEFGIYGPDD